MWKRLMVADAEKGGADWRREALMALGLAVAAGVAIKVPAFFGIGWDGDVEAVWYIRNISLFTLPFLAAFLGWKRTLPTGPWTGLVGAFVAAALVMNLMPFVPEGHTEMLAILHLPIALWLAAGLAYVGGQWRDPQQRMNYVRFSGEWFIYYVLIALGGGVLMGITMLLFEAAGMDAEPLVTLWILPCGAVGAVVIAGWLVEAKQSVIENMAPVLTMLFTPLFTILLLAFLITVAWTGSGINIEREVLIGFDLLLVVVAGLLLYSISARDPQAEPGFFDAMQLALVVCALLVDAMALWAILALHAQPRSSPGREPDPGGEPGLVRRALRAVPAEARGLRTPGAVADGVPAGVRRVGVDRGGDLPANLQVPVGGRGNEEVAETSPRRNQDGPDLGIRVVRGGHGPTAHRRT